LEAAALDRAAASYLESARSLVRSKPWPTQQLIKTSADLVQRLADLPDSLEGWLLVWLIARNRGLPGLGPHGPDEYEAALQHDPKLVWADVARARDLLQELVKAADGLKTPHPRERDGAAQWIRLAWRNWCEAGLAEQPHGRFSRALAVHKGPREIPSVVQPGADRVDRDRLKRALGIS
jgi:hypothetical protein